MKLSFLPVLMFLAATCFALVSKAAPVHVALIFDDGPTVDQAPKFLTLFAAEGVHVTFGSEAQYIAAHADIAKAVIAGGHEIANHSYTHQHPKELDDATLEHEIVGAQKTIAGILGAGAPVWYWPPFLESDDRVRAMAAKANLKVYVPKHLVVSADYDLKVSADELRKRATTGVVDGTVILFHEWRKETFDQMPAILAELKRQGCEFMTFSQLAEYVTAKK
jgi:peptidoglycan/xylan/chitin deacetylase (PgdA/CDA1 family)